MLLDATMKVPHGPSASGNTVFFLKLSKQLLWGYWGPECQPAGSGRVTGKVMVDMIDADNYFEICSKRWQGGRQEAWWMMRVESSQIGNT